MNKLLIIFSLLIGIQSIHAPTLSYAQKDDLKAVAQDKAKLEKEALIKSLKNYNLFRQQEDTLKILMDSMRSAKTYDKRKEACYQLIPKFVKTLKTAGSFDYPFDSLTGISKLTPPDESFKLFTWVLPRIEGTPSSYTESYRYFGAIMMNNKKDSSDFKLYGLVDQSAEIGSPEAEELTPKNWYGALYYNIRQNKGTDGTTYYTLFGWDGYNELSSKKLVDVLYFDKDNNPIFGAPIFDIVKAEEKKQYTGNRMILEYRKAANVGLNFIKEKNIIIYDHLIPEAKDDLGNYENYVPDGSYEGLEFKGGMWKYVPKIFFETLSAPPRPKPVLGSGSKGKKVKNKGKKKKSRKK